MSQQPSHRIVQQRILCLVWFSVFFSFAELSSALSLSSKTATLPPTLPPGTTKPLIPPDAQVLSEDPLVYIIPNLLSYDECEAYQQYVQNLEQEGGDRSMTRSNPPEVSIQTEKLWPLPFLSLLAGLPSVAKLDWATLSANGDTDTILWRVLTAACVPVVIALAISFLLVALAPSLVQMVSNAQARTSEAIALNQEEDIEFITPLVNRVESATGLSWKHWEAPVVTRYQPGAIFSRHGDSSPTFQGEEWAAQGGQRILTCICYLNALPKDGGGETYFDQLDLAVEPKPGQALVFVPSNWSTLQADDRTTHESLPPISEEKWIVQIFGRVGPRVPAPLGLPDRFSK